MNLLGSIAKLQKIGIQFYLELAQAFNSNELIHSTWLALAQDLEQQTASLKELPQSFWKKLEMPEAELPAAAPFCQDSGQAEGGRSLVSCFGHILDFEEPIILKVYVPVIRRLRTAWLNQALDFYIIVKAHVARLAHLVEPYSIDPALVHRSIKLIELFEKEVQSPPAPIRVLVTHRRKKTKSARESKRATAAKTRTTRTKLRAKKYQNPVKRKKSIPTRAKPIISKIEVGRRRARR
jgi:hypothetical protein